jgi:uncharacterized protein (TIGR03086 family)
MNEVSDRYRRLSSAFAGRIEGASPDRWNAITPCPDWTVHDLIRHVVEMNGAHLGRIGRPIPPGPSVDVDPLGAFTAVRDEVQANLDDPARAARQFDGPMGRCTYAEAIDRFICFELLVHGWDLARATGQDERIEPAEIALLWQAIKQAGEEMMRSEGVFDSSVAVPADADEQTRLLAYLGRRV